MVSVVLFKNTKYTRYVASSVSHWHSIADKFLTPFSYHRETSSSGISRHVELLKSVILFAYARSTCVPEVFRLDQKQRLYKAAQAQVLLARSGLCISFSLA